KEKNSVKKGIQNRNDDDKVDENSINKYCKCVEAYCNCCREFRLPVVELNGPGCASLMYLNGDKMSVSLSFGKKVITNRTLSSRKPSPVCMPLPGGLSKFCGRVYNIARAGEEFRACLGLELQSKSTVEAAVRVSCFKFGPRGVTSEPADPLPLYFHVLTFFRTLDAVNDVDSADYTGFSLLGEDILGDLFGSTGGKKSNKNKKKQAPAPSTTTTTTTRRPRPSRRPSRRPGTKSTTPRPRRTTTVKTRPSAGNKRPTRRPNRRPTRRPTTESTSTSILTTTTTVSPTPSSISTSQVTERIPIITTIQEQSQSPVSAFAENPTPAIVAVTTAKSVTDFEDPGLEMSLAHITGQLSAMPVTPMISNDGKVSSVMDKEEESDNYEKIMTITPKTPSTISFVPTSEETVNEDMIQIVQSLDSAEREPISGDESRAHMYQFSSPVPDSYYEGLSLPKKKNRNKQFNFRDLDVLNLSQIGETLGDELGIFGKNKRQHRDNKDTKVQGQKEQSDEYDDFVDTISDMALMMRKDSNKNQKNKKDRRRQNKMMREWSQV
ncbi:hypothetical protein HW555_001362, partial [Spodoptera exigua]